MPWIGGLIAGGIGLLGSSMTSNAARGAADTSAAGQIEAARIAADASRFRPVGITNRFGSSRFTTDAAGNLTGAGYDVSPEIARMRDWLINQAGNQGINTSQAANEQGQGLFNLAKGYMAKTPEQAAAEWMTKQQALLQPSRDVEMAKLQNQLSNTGRSGLSIAQGGNLGAANPEMQALMNARAMQDLQLAAQAQEQGRAQTTFGAGLFDQGIKTQTAGISPLTSFLGGASSIEDLARANLTTGSELGGRAATAGGNVGQALLQGGMGAARTVQGASASPWGSALMGMANNNAFTNGVANWFKPQTVPGAVTGAYVPGYDPNYQVYGF